MSAEKDTMTGARSSRAWSFQIPMFSSRLSKVKEQLSTQFDHSPTTVKDVTRILLRSLYRNLLNVVVSNVHSDVSATYPDVNLTLCVRVEQREKCGSNIVWVCAVLLH